MNDEKTRRGPGRPQNPDLARRILDAAREVVATVGVRDASMSAIADAARCGKPSIYLRWPSLEAVVQAALEDVAQTDELHTRFLAAVKAMDALLEVEHGRFLAEAAVLPSAVEQVRRGADGVAGQLSRDKVAEARRGAKRRPRPQAGDQGAEPRTPQMPMTGREF